ncbi:MAG: hypothetical protein Q4D98_07160 [Planctomycetia bacterium]|nr:hypothetical protein [Planctomycetia bacterium]
MSTKASTHMEKRAILDAFLSLGETDRREVLKVLTGIIECGVH